MILENLDLYGSQDKPGMVRVRLRADLFASQVDLISVEQARALMSRVQEAINQAVRNERKLHDGQS